MPAEISKEKRTASSLVKSQKTKVNQDLPQGKKKNWRTACPKVQLEFNFFRSE